MGAEDNRRVVGFSLKVDAMLGGGGQRHLQFRITSFYLQQFRHQPADRTGRRFQAHDGLLLARLLGHRYQAAECRL